MLVDCGSVNSESLDSNVAKELATVNDGELRGKKARCQRRSSQELDEEGGGTELSGPPSSQLAPSEAVHPAGSTHLDPSK